MSSRSRKSAAAEVRSQFLLVTGQPAGRLPPTPMELTVLRITFTDTGCSNECAGRADGPTRQQDRVRAAAHGTRKE